MITSVQNGQVKQWNKLKIRKHRQREQQFLIEGFHLIEEAYKSGWNIDQLIYDKAIEARLPVWSKQMDSVAVNDKVFKEVAQTVHPQGIAAVVNMKRWENIENDYILLLDAIQDPGNLGTIIRTADAAGFSKVVLGHGTVDVYNDKVIRASQGSLFHIPVISDQLEVEIARLKKESVTILATALYDADVYHHIEIDGRFGLMLGNEGSGIRNSLLKLADRRVTIPIYGQAESLNVSIAAGILMYHFKR